MSGTAAPEVSGTLRAYHDECGQITFDDFVYEGDEVELKRQIRALDRSPAPADMVSRVRYVIQTVVEICTVVRSASGSFVLRPLTQPELVARADRILAKALAGC